MSRQKKARVAAQANNKSQNHNSTPRPVSKYQRKQYERTSLGQAMLAALRGGQQ